MVLWNLIQKNGFEYSISKVCKWWHCVAATNLKRDVCNTEETLKDLGVLAQILMKVLHTSEKMGKNVILLRNNPQNIFPKSDGCTLL